MALFRGTGGSGDASTDTYASEVAIEATRASTKANEAAASATSAASSFDSFDDRYLGAKSSDPSVDNDGDALIVGALYFNSTGGVMSVWSGSSWTAINAASSYSAPTLGSTIIPSGTTVGTIAGLTLTAPTLTGTVTASGDINLSAVNGPGSLIDELTLIMMGAL